MLSPLFCQGERTKLDRDNNVKSSILFFSNNTDRGTRSSTDEGFLMKVPFCKT